MFHGKIKQDSKLTHVLLVCEMRWMKRRVEKETKKGCKSHPSRRRLLIENIFRIFFESVKYEILIWKIN